MNSDHESEWNFPSSTFKVEENKVPLFLDQAPFYSRVGLGEVK